MGQENSLPNGDRDDAKCPWCDKGWDDCECVAHVHYPPEDTRNIITGEEDE